MNSIECLPEGRTIRYFTDRDGGYYVCGEGPPRKATPEEHRMIRRNELAQRYADNGIRCCDSCLVSALLENCAAGVPPHNPLTEFSSGLWDEFQWDNIENVYADASEWSMEQCREYLEEHGADAPDPNPWAMTKDQLIEELAQYGLDAGDMRENRDADSLRAELIEAMDDMSAEGLEEWRDRAQHVANDNPAEVFEWWRVDTWLCEQLKSIGEVVLDNGYGKWWGRCTTGQNYLMDGVLQRIADQYLE
jgi:hypothetical protein